jgi:hypothetical protein
VKLPGECATGKQWSAVYVSDSFKPDPTSDMSLSHYKIGAYGLCLLLQQQIQVFQVEKGGKRGRKGIC